MLRDDGSTVQLYHAADELSKGVRIYRIQGSCQDHEQGSLPVTRCTWDVRCSRKRVRRADTGPGTNLKDSPNRCRVSPVLSKGEKYRLGKLEVP